MKSHGQRGYTNGKATIPSRLASSPRSGRKLPRNYLLRISFNISNFRMTSQIWTILSIFTEGKQYGNYQNKSSALLTQVN